MILHRLTPSVSSRPDRPTLRMPKIPMFLFQNNLHFNFSSLWCGCLAFTVSSEGFLYEIAQTVFFVNQVFFEKYSLIYQRKIFKKSRSRLNLVYKKNSLTFANKNPAHGKCKVVTPEKSKFLCPPLWGLCVRDYSGKPDRDGNALNILFILLHKQMYIQGIICFVLKINQVRNNVRSDSHLIKPAR